LLRTLEHDLSSVLVLTDSHITSIVICRIVERLGLRSTADKPDCPPQIIDRHRPFLVILDGGADGRSCDAMLTDLGRRRSVTGRPMPRVILLVNSTSGPVISAAHVDVVDHVVAKPITPDSLQPKILAQLARLRDGL